MASPLPPDDLPAPFTPLDRLLRLRLQEKTAAYFYQSCDRITQILLSYCRWELSFKTDALTLIIHCIDGESYWHMMSMLQLLGDRLERIGTDRAKIRICPPEEQGQAFEVQVNEISTYWDSP